MKIAVLFDGAGLARLGLEQSGHECTGYELDPSKHFLSQFVGSGNCILQDATTVDLTSFDAIWASPPCQNFSDQNRNKKQDYLLDWSLSFIDQYPDKIIWIENVVSRNHDNSWGKKFNAAQFLENPIQNRKRVIGGNYKDPFTYRQFQHSYPKLKICPAILGSENRPGNITNKQKSCFNKAARFYGRKLTEKECAYHQGFTIPDEWYKKMDGFTDSKWLANIYQAIGNGVPVYMAKAFGDMYSVD